MSLNIPLSPVFPWGPLSPVPGSPFFPFSPIVPLGPVCPFSARRKNLMKLNCLIYCWAGNPVLQAPTFIMRLMSWSIKSDDVITHMILKIDHNKSVNKCTVCNFPHWSSFQGIPNLHYLEYAIPSVILQLKRNVIQGKSHDKIYCC